MAAKRSVKYAVLAVAVLALACLSLTFPGRLSDLGTASGGGGAGGGEVELLETRGKRREASSGAEVAAREIAKASAQDSALEAKIAQARQIKDSLSSQVERARPALPVPRHPKFCLPSPAPSRRSHPNFCPCPQAMKIHPAVRHTAAACWIASSP